MDYTPKVFTRDNPCTKIEIHNCFYAGGRYINRKVIEAKTVIGENTPKYLIREGYMTVISIEHVDYYHLTAEGDAWIRQGILRFLTLHPERAGDCLQLPIGYSRGAVKPPAAAPKGATPRPVLIRRRAP